MKNTSLCYLERGGQYLMLHRVKKENDENHDKWIGVGGKFEPGESPEDCVCREVREETGLRLTDYRYCGIVTFVNGDWTEYMHLFHATGFEGQLRECDEGVLEWIDKKKLYDLQQWEGDKIFLRLMDMRVPFFSLKLVYEGDALTAAVLNGERKPVLSVEALMGRYQLVPVCPEQLGGLPTPREPSERQGDLVVMKSGLDVTAQYQRGAEQALHLARVFGCKKAVLKERSPSCGSGEIYDGTFSGKLTPGDGVTAALFNIETLLEQAEDTESTLF